MAKKLKAITCLVADSMRDIINAAKEEDIPREDIVNILVLNKQVYLVYYK